MRSLSVFSEINSVYQLVLGKKKAFTSLTDNINKKVTYYDLFSLYLLSLFF